MTGEIVLIFKSAMSGKLDGVMVLILLDDYYAQHFPHRMGMKREVTRRSPHGEMAAPLTKLSKGSRNV